MTPMSGFRPESQFTYGRDKLAVKIASQTVPSLKKSNADDSVAPPAQVENWLEIFNMSPHKKLHASASYDWSNGSPGAIALSCLTATVTGPSEPCPPEEPSAVNEGDREFSSVDCLIWFDVVARELHVMKKRQFQLASQAKAQIHLLSVLQRARWPLFAAGVFTGCDGIFAEHALRDAIKGINHRGSRIKLRQDGDGVRWQLRRGRKDTSF